MIKLFFTWSSGWAMQYSPVLFLLIPVAVVAKYDVLVIGAGPAGCQAATDAASRGFRVGLVEKKASTTCAPSGMHSKSIKEAVSLGARNFTEVEAFVTQAIDRAQAASEAQFRTLQVDVLTGSGQFIDDKTFHFNSSKGEELNVKARAFMIATGSHAFRLPDVQKWLSFPGVFDEDTIDGISYLPKRVVVQGAGSIGLEYAISFAKLGAQVTAVDIADEILTELDLDVRSAVLKTLRDAGVEVVLSNKYLVVEKAAIHPDGIAWKPLLTVTLDNQTIDCDCFLSAIARRGNVEGLGLELLQPLGLSIDRHGMILTDTNQRVSTNLSNIFAIGDVARGHYATVGQAQAMRAVKAFAGQLLQSLRVHPNSMPLPYAMPLALWLSPSIAWAGITESQASKTGVKFETVHSYYNETARGWVSGASGFLKLIFLRDVGTVLGVHIFGPDSPDLVNYGADVINKNHTIFDILDFVFPAVTSHQLYHLAVAKAQRCSLQTSSLALSFESRGVMHN